MILFPAIDIKEGKVVRLIQGRFDQVTEYNDDPFKIAEYWKLQGAQWLHLVDLDGARTGEMTNIGVIKKIAKNIGIPIQVGGGVRNMYRIQELIDAGVKRVILGTKAISDKGLMDEVIKNWSDSVAVSIDCVRGLVTQRGWVEKTDIKGTDFAKQLESDGIKYIIYTDVKRDGMLQGLNWDRVEQILEEIKVNVIASGGISNDRDIIRLCSLNLKYPHLIGAITGRAIYEEKLNFDLALKMIRNYENNPQEYAE